MKSKLLQDGNILIGSLVFTATENVHFWSTALFLFLHWIFGLSAFDKLLIEHRRG